MSGLPITAGEKSSTAPKRILCQDERSGAATYNTKDGDGNIEGKITGEVTSETTVKDTLTSGFNWECDGDDLGPVTGSYTGTQAKGSSILTFAEAKGMEFLKTPWTITGSSETKTAVAAKEAIFIN